MVAGCVHDFAPNVRNAVWRWYATVLVVMNGLVTISTLTDRLGLLAGGRSSTRAHRHPIRVVNWFMSK